MSVVHTMRPAGPSSPVMLRDGSAVQLRPAGPHDEVALRAFLEGVSPDSLRRRFFGTPDLGRTARSLVEGCGAAYFGLVVHESYTPAIVAHAGWFRIDSKRAEAAFLVTDSWQGRGLGALLLSRLAQSAEQRGIATLVAEVLPGNRAMLTVFERCGYLVEVCADVHGVEVQIDLTSLAPALAQAA
ncbi:MAG TPA: GNAT family N-acetyltransferase [Solirubrobacteraceae bacterium]